MTFMQLSKNQEAVFEQIAIGNDASHNVRTLDSLERRGLIEKYQEPFVDHVGRTFIYRYRVPVHIHIEWCDWCNR